MASDETTTKVRLVRCPKCRLVLPEVADVPVYRCGRCDTVLAAKNRKTDAKTTSLSQQPGATQINGFVPASQNNESNSSTHDSLVQSLDQQSGIRMKLLTDLVPGCNKITIERIFAAINFLLELPSAVLDQLSSEPRPLFALILLLLSCVALVICIIELVYKGTREKVISELWFMVPRRYLRKNPFCSFSNIVGLTCAFCQCIFTTVNYAMVLQHRKIHVQISVMPIVFAFVLLCSKFCSNPEQRKSEAEEA